MEDGVKQSDLRHYATSAQRIHNSYPIAIAETDSIEEAVTLLKAERRRLNRFIWMNGPQAPQPETVLKLIKKYVLIGNVIREIRHEYHG